MSIYFIGKCASIIQLSLGDLFWQACSSKEAHVNRHSSSESELLNQVSYLDWLSFIYLNDLQIFSGKSVENFVDGGGGHKFFLIVVKHLFNVLE